jgi:hypothetical protein
VVAVIALALGACASGPPAPVVDLSKAIMTRRPPGSFKGRRRPRHVPRRARRHASTPLRSGMDWIFASVAAWNNIAPPYRIYAWPGSAPGRAERNHSPTSVATPVPPPRSAAAGHGNIRQAQRGGGPGAVKPGMFEDVPPPNAPVATPKAPAATGDSGQLDCVGSLRPREAQCRNCRQTGCATRRRRSRQ